MRQSLFVVVGFFLAFAGACSSGPAAGDEGGACYPNGTCNAGLTCLSQLCVNAGSDASTDAASDGASDATADVSADAPAGCATYTKSTIAAMRTGATNGCFELDDVITLGVTSSTTDPRLFVQDATGGDYSAMLGTCSSTSTTHPCTVAAAVSTLPAAHSVTLRGSFVVNKSTTLEQLFIDSVTDNGAGATPSVATATLAQISRASTAANLRYQRVTVALGGTLVMYDWSPSELAVANATSCPYQLGFGMIAQTAGATPGLACSNGTSQPAGQTSPNSQEVLIGTDFSQAYKVSSDCRCAKSAGDMEPGVVSTLTGTLAGVLVFDVSGSTGFYYIAPQSGSDAPVNGTVSGQ